MEISSKPMAIIFGTNSSSYFDERADLDMTVFVMAVCSHMIIEMRGSAGTLFFQF